MRCPIEVFVGQAKAVTVTIPSMNRSDVIDVLATFLGRDEPEVTGRLKGLLKGGGDVTLIVTSRHTCEERR